jgi:hypothetical protein
VEVETVGGMTCRFDHLLPKPIRGLVFIKHGSCHLYESTVLPFDHSILLRGIESRKLIFDAFFLQKVFYLSFLKFGAIVTFYLLYFGIKFIFCHSQKFL